MADNGWNGGICHAETGLPKLLIFSLERVGVVDPLEYVYREYDSRGHSSMRHDDLRGKEHPLP